MLNEKELDLKYVVFKIKDINKILTKYERKLLWSFLLKIIKAHNNIKERNRELEAARTLCIKQFKHDINQITDVETLSGFQLRELLDKYDIR